MKISPDVDAGPMGGVKVRNVMIDLLGKDGRPSIRYKITTQP